MRILLRDATTGLYYSEFRVWTLESEKARSFRHSAEAMDVAREEGVLRAEVVLASVEPDFTIALPLPESIPSATAAQVPL